jgi:hypothetical protein
MSGAAASPTTLVTTTTSSAAQRVFKVLYWLCGVALLCVAFRVLFAGNRQVAAVLVFLLGIAALAFYWTRWLAPPSAASQRWPPYVTACPDFLTLVEVPDASGGTDASGGGGGGGTQHVCVDYVGVSTNGGLLRLDAKDGGKSLANPAYQFPVRKRGASETQAAYKTAMCAAAATAGLSWSTLCGDQAVPTA